MIFEQGLFNFQLLNFLDNRKNGLDPIFTSFFSDVNQSLVNKLKINFWSKNIFPRLNSTSNHFNHKQQNPKLTAILKKSSANFQNPHSIKIYPNKS